MSKCLTKRPVYADSAWFKYWNKHHKAAFIVALEKALTRIEDSGVNLAEVFSLKPDVHSVKEMIQRERERGVASSSL